MVHEVVPPPYTPYPDVVEHKIVQLSNGSWSSSNTQEKAQQNAERGTKPGPIHFHPFDHIKKEPIKIVLNVAN